MTVASRVAALATAIGNYLRDSVLPRLVPAGGTAGQVFTKTSSADYAAAWQAPGGGSTVTLDFGTVAVRGMAFSIANANVTTASKISMTSSASTANGALGGDELEMDGFSVAAYCAVNGTITAYVQALPGPVQGKRNFNLTLG